MKLTICPGANFVRALIHVALREFEGDGLMTHESEVWGKV